MSERSRKRLLPWDRGQSTANITRNKSVRLLHDSVRSPALVLASRFACFRYVPSNDQFPEVVCAENVRWFPGTEATVPTANKPDF